MQFSLGAREIYARHEMHHMYVKKNYGPFLPWWDVLLGTGKEIEKEKWSVTYHMEQKLKNLK